LLVQALAGGLPDGVERTLERATTYGRAGAVARSLDLLGRALTARPTEPSFWLLRGRYLLARQSCAAALSDFSHAAELAPANPLAHASLGLARLCRGDQAGALAAFRRSLELDPNQPEIRRFLGGGR
jgi:Flp pilus assembly protein TadD